MPKGIALADGVFCQPGWRTRNVQSYLLFSLWMLGILCPHFVIAPQASISHFSFYLVDTFLLPFMCILAFCFSLLFCFAFYWHYETLCSSGAEAFFGLVNMESCNYICICGWG